MTDTADPGAPTPDSASNQSSGTPPGGSGLPENVAGALSYLLGPITGVAFFIIDRPRPFVRFHAVQAIAISIVWVVLAVILMVLSAILGFIPILGWLVSLLLSLGLSLAGFVLWLWLMWQAYQGREWEVPGLGPHVRRIAEESAGAAPPSGPGS
jgi:uncharacterized membrane protein